jgi:predicted PurR-regulated permease PerM
MSVHLPAPPSLSRALLEVLLVVAGVAAGAWLLHRLASVALILVLSALFAYVIAPLVEIVARPVRICGRSRRLSRPTAICVVYLTMAGGVATGGAILLPRVADQGADVLARAPAYAQAIVVWEHGWSRYYERLRIPPQLRRDIDQSARSAGEAAVTSGRTSLVAVAVALSNLPWLILIPILAFFLLKDAAGIRRAALSVLPHGFRLRGHRLFEDLNATLAAYIRAQLLACALVGGLCGIGFAILGIPYPALLGVLAGVLEFIPLVGPLLVAAAAGVIASLHSLTLGLAAVGFLAVLRVVEDYVIYPRLIRHGLKLHPLAVIVAVLAGAELNGIAGVFLAVPAAAMASVVGRHWLDWHRHDAVEAAALIGPSARAGPVPFGTR